MRTRAFRRHQGNRLRKRYRRLLESWKSRNLPGGWSHEDMREYLDRQVQLYASTHGKPCSCWMCGNQRSVEGPTMQERRAPDPTY